MSTLGISERGGPWYVTEYAAVNNDGAHAEVLLGRTDWADWDHRGDLEFARGGQLSRLSVGKGGGLASSPAKLLADFSGRTFSEVVPPVEARQWWSTLPE